jgi:hypothetical protein
MDRRQFLGAAVVLPFSRRDAAMAKPTEFHTCTCGDFEPGPMAGTNGPVQCENCRGWVNNVRAERHG